MTDFDTATGRLYVLLPPGRERDELLHLVRLGAAFSKQHCGKRREFLHNYIIQLVGKMGLPATFEKLLEELELEAARRDLHGESASPVERVNRVFGLMTYHDPKKGRQQRTFKTIQNYFTTGKRLLNPDIP